MKVNYFTQAEKFQNPRKGMYATISKYRREREGSTE